MKTLHTKAFQRDFQDLPREIQSQAEKQLALFVENPRHPSLRIKKMEGFRNIWEGRITRSYRFTFQLEDDTVILRRIGTHDTLKHP